MVHFFIEILIRKAETMIKIGISSGLFMIEQHFTFCVSVTQKLYIRNVRKLYIIFGKK